MKPFKEAIELIHPLDFEKVMDSMKLSEQRKKLRKTAWSVIQDEVDERIEQIRRETEHNKQVEIARQMKADGVPDETIARYTGLTPDEIAAL